MTFDEYTHPKDRLVAVMRRIYSSGMTTTSGGNLSILDDNGDMWITPAGIDKGTLTRDDIMCVKKDGSIVGKHRPSSEYPFHKSIYARRPDVRGILHAHPPTLVSFSVGGVVPNTSVLPTARNICGEVGFAPYAIPGSEELGRNISDVFAQGYYTVLLENHGVVTADSSLEAAFQRFETLDFCARLIYRASRLGKVNYLTDVQIDYDAADRNQAFREGDFDAHSPEELELRYQMCELIHRAYRKMLFTSTEGTFSVRLDDKRFLITPYGLDRDVLTPGDLVLVDDLRYERGKPLSRAAWFFREIYRTQPEVKSLIISSAPYVMAYGVANAKFDPRVIPESYIMLREVPMFEFGAHYADVKKVANVISPRHPVILVKNGFLLTCGKSLLEAYDRMEVAEYSAQAAIAAHTLGGMRPINDEQVDDLVAAFKLPK